MGNANLSDHIWCKLLTFLKTQNTDLYRDKKSPVENLLKPYFRYFAAEPIGDYCHPVEEI